MDNLYITFPYTNSHKIVVTESTIEKLRNLLSNDKFWTKEIGGNEGVETTAESVKRMRVKYDYIINYIQYFIREATTDLNRNFLRKFVVNKNNKDLMFGLLFNSNLYSADNKPIYLVLITNIGILNECRDNYPDNKLDFLMGLEYKTKNHNNYHNNYYLYDVTICPKEYGINEYPYRILVNNHIYQKYINYFSLLSLTVDTTIHHLLEHVDRIPKDIMSDLLNEEDTQKLYEGLNNKDLQSLKKNSRCEFNQKRESIINNIIGKDGVTRILTFFRQSLDLSLQKIRENPRLVVPKLLSSDIEQPIMEKNQCEFILPLYKNSADLYPFMGVLLVGKFNPEYINEIDGISNDKLTKLEFIGLENMNYSARTYFNMEMIDKDSRLVNGIELSWYNNYILNVLK